MLGAYRARAVPFNVNQHYRPAEVARPAGRRRHPGGRLPPALGPLVAAASTTRRASVARRRRRRLGRRAAAGQHAVRGRGRHAGRRRRCPSRRPTTSTWCAPAARPAAPRPCSGARPTSSCRPWPAPRAPPPSRSPPAPPATAGGPWFAAPPLMHAAAQWTAFCGLHDGRHRRAPRRLAAASTPAAILELAERERVDLMSIVGDAYAGPLVDELRRRHLRPVVAVASSAPAGRPRASSTRRRCSSSCPHLTIVDGYGASETGGMAFGARSTDRRRRRASRPAPAPRWSSADRTRFLEPGDDEIGWTARRGRVPLGYLGDREATEATFPIVDGERRGGPRRPGPAPRRRHRSAARPRLDGGEHRRREGVRRGGRGGAARATPTSPTRSSSAGRPSASARRSSRSWRRAAGATVDPAELREFVAAEHRPVQGAAGRRRVRRGAPPRQRQGRLPRGPRRSRVDGRRRRPATRALMDLGVRDHGYLIFGGTAGIGSGRGPGAGRRRRAGRGRRPGSRSGPRPRPPSCRRPPARRSSPWRATSPRPARPRRWWPRPSSALGGLRGMAVTTGLGTHGQRDLLGGTDDDWAARSTTCCWRPCGPAGPRCPCWSRAAAARSSRPRRTRSGPRSPTRSRTPRSKAGVATLTKDLAKALRPGRHPRQLRVPGRHRDRHPRGHAGRTSPRSGAGRSRRRSSG